MNFTGTQTQIRDMLKSLGKQMTIEKLSGKRIKTPIVIITEKNEDVTAISTGGNTSQLQTVGYCDGLAGVLVEVGDTITSSDYSYTISSVSQFRVNDVNVATKMVLVG